jgi:hypothetical protein
VIVVGSVVYVFLKDAFNKMTDDEREEFYRRMSEDDFHNNNLGI